MDSTVQTVQEVGNQVSQYRQMFENYLPDITKFGIKVVLAIVDEKGVLNIYNLVLDKACFPFCMILSFVKALG